MPGAGLFLATYSSLQPFLHREDTVHIWLATMNQYGLEEGVVALPHRRCPSDQNARRTCVEDQSKKLSD